LREERHCKNSCGLERILPLAKHATDEAVQRTLGSDNQRISKAARQAIETGDAEKLGALMTEAQHVFDENLMPVCTELLSPKLHRVLADAQVKTLVYGGKGVGSQGDGCVQFICKGVAERHQLTTYLTTTFGLPCFDLDMCRPASVRKAVIPVAGLGTRMFPYTKAVPKTFLPVVTPEGIAKPVIQVIVEEALSAGVEEVALIIQPEDEARFRSYFQTAVRVEALNKLPAQLREEAEKLKKMSSRITYIPQPEAKGFGHAVLLAEKFVANEPFLLMLGDHLFRSSEGRSVARQVVDRFQDFGDAQSVVGIYEETLEKTKHYGTITGEWVSDETLQLTRIVEKPTEDQAITDLQVGRHGKSTYFCVNGVYVLRSKIFDILRASAAAGRAREIELTAALETLREEEGVKGLVVNGRHFDTGLPQIYAETISRFASN
jgi:UTP-glucose-1-phosphate uridylyltransferase